MIDLPVLDKSGKQVDTLAIDETALGNEVRPDLLKQAYVMYHANRRQGSARTKSRGMVEGSTRKLYRQKGTGRARHGSRKAPIFVGGGVAFGPRVRDHAHKLPKKVRRLALKTALSAKQAEGKLVVLDSVNLDEPKTGHLSKRLAALGWTSVLVIDGTEVDNNFKRAAANLPGVDVLPCQGANVYDILRRDTLVLTKAAVAALEARLK